MSGESEVIVSDKLTYLREIDIFQDLAPAEIAALGEHTPMKHVDAALRFMLRTSRPKYYSS